MKRPRYAELKGADVRMNSVTFLATTNTNASLVVPTLILHGVNSQERVGDKISLHSLRYRACLEISSFASATTGNYLGNAYRIVVVYDAFPGGSNPTFETIFGLLDAAGTVTHDVLDPVNYAVTRRFKVLSDLVRYVEFPPAPPASGTVNAVIQTVVHDEFISLKGLETHYDKNDVTTSGQIYIFFRARTNNGAVATVTTTNEAWCRLRYTDQ